MATTATKVLAPGARVIIRDEEWIVRKEEPASLGGKAIHVTGQSELVSGKEAVFLTDLDQVTELRPDETELVADPSPNYRRSRLYIESLLRRSPPTDNALYVGHRAAMREANYQLQPAAMALGQLRSRILMADGVGLGKTVEVGVLLSELIRRGRGERILVVALKSILAQFQEELWARFTIPLVRLDSVGIQRVQSRIPSSMNPFYYFDRVIISIDTLKKDVKYRRFLEESRWDVVVVDECQNVAVRTRTRSGRGSQRAQLAQLLARTTDALILTSATPHDGRPESFASLMRLLEPTAIADETKYTSEEVSDYFLRRFKKDIAHEVSEAFHERSIKLTRVAASGAEDAVFSALRKATFQTIDRKKKKSKGILFRTLLLKSFLSSPTALIDTVNSRLGHKDLEDRADSQVAHDRHTLEHLRELAAKVDGESFRKLGVLVDALRKLGVGVRGSTERVVIFSERIATLEYLYVQLQQSLGLKENQLEVFHGSLDDQKQKSLIRRFGVEKSPIRVLLASDAASEGINLHFFCHHMIHFDLPWSLITLEQRNGRIDRFGQAHPPMIECLLTVPSSSDLKGDLRVLERLVEKEDMAHHNLGDTAWLMGLFDAEEEEERIAEAIQGEVTPEEAIPDEPEHEDFLGLLSGHAGTDGPAVTTRDPLSLYPNELDYARQALAEIACDDPSVVEWHDHLNGFSLHAPEDLKRRYEFLPSELRRNSSEMKLTADRQLVMDALEASREDEGNWPEWELFWELHPVSEWLADRVLGSFDRHEAPVLRVARGIERDERVFVFQGVVSNHRSQPVLVEWFGLGFRASECVWTRTLRDLSTATGLSQALANPGEAGSPEWRDELMLLRGAAVEAARAHLDAERRARASQLGESLRTNVRTLAQWQRDAEAAIQAREHEAFRRGRQLSPRQKRALHAEKQEVKAIHDERREWVEQSMTTVPEPYLRLVAVLVHQEA